MYPTRAVRHAAWDALDFLFPVSCSLFFFFLIIVIIVMVLNLCVETLLLWNRLGNTHGML